MKVVRIFLNWIFTVLNRKPGMQAYSFSLCMLLLYSNSYAQTAQPQNPVGINQSTTPQFSALSASLSSSIQYTIAVSEIPRGGTAAQYSNFWVKGSLSSTDLLESNPNRLKWSSGWEQRIRSGGNDAPVTQIIQGSPVSLSLGKTYYWHIVGNNGTKSVEASFTVGNVPSQPDLTIFPNHNRNLFEVSWTQVANATRYELTRNGGLISTTSAQLSGSVYKLGVSVLSQGVNETFNIKACNSFGCSSGQNKIANYPVPPMTAVIQGPLVGSQTNNSPIFFASSLQANTTYTVAISEASRSGLNNQFINFWVSPAMTNGQVSWGTNWLQRTRNGNPDGEAQLVSSISPPTLTNGKTYYWHIVGAASNGGFSKSAQGQFTVGVVPVQPDITVSPNLNRTIFSVTWTAVGNTTRYELTRNGTVINLANAQLVGSSYKLDVGVLSPGMDETFTIKACNSLGCSAGQHKIANYPVPPQIAVIQSPIGTTKNIPSFTATGLQTNTTYTVAISESPRAGLNNQFVDLWVSPGMVNGQVVWGSNWQRRTRNGNPDGESQIVQGAAPLSLTIGKTYYWHVVGAGANGGMSKSAQGQFTVQRDSAVITNATNFVSNIGSTTPCFSWSVSAPYKSSIEIFTVEGGVKALFAKKAVTSSPEAVCLDKTWTYSNGTKALPLYTLISWQIKSYLNTESDSLTTYVGSNFQTRPNIVIIYADDLGWDDINTGVGNGVVTTTGTSKITSFSQQSNAVTFSNAYSNAAVCSPSRASLLSGKYPVKHRVFSVNKKTQKDDDMPVFSEPQINGSKLLSQRLDEAGYATALIGKWHLSDATPSDGTNNFDGSDWRATNKGFNINWGGNQAGQPYSYESDANKKFLGIVDTTLFTMALMQKSPALPSEKLYSPGDVLENETDLSNVLGTITKRYISDQHNYRDMDSRKLTQPFFVYNALYDPHLPVPMNDPACPDKTLPGLTKLNYECMMKRVDNAVKGVLDSLASDSNSIKLDKTNSTYVVFTSDNGTNSRFAALYQNRLKGYKLQAYEGGVRIPLVIAGPGITAKVSHTPVITSDLYSTLLGFAGLQVNDSTIDSKDLRAMLLTYPTSASVPVPVAPDPLRPLFWYNPIVHHKGVENLSGAYTAVRSGKYKLISHFYPHSIGVVPNKKEYLLAELYDLSQTPKEDCNLLEHVDEMTPCGTTMTRAEIKNEYLRLNNLLRSHVAQVCLNQKKDEPSNFAVPIPNVSSLPDFKVYEYLFLPEFEVVISKLREDVTGMLSNELVKPRFFCDN